MSYYLFLDDIRELKDVTWMPIPEGEWAIVRDYQAFVRMIERKGMPAFISFDHDLGLEHMHDYLTVGHLTGKLAYDKYKEKTGMDCAKWLVNYCLDKSLKLPDYQVHSMNHVGKANIISLLENFKKVS